MELDKVLAAAGEKKRDGPSGRMRKLTEKVKVVDASKREELRRNRLEALEKDNYEEEEPQIDDDEYNPLFDDEDDERVKVSASGSRRKTGRKRSEISTEVVVTNKRAGIQRFNASLQEMDLDKQWSANVSLYASIAAAAPATPPRTFCSVCGYVSTYTCTRCGARFCSLNCYKIHRDTRCLKFIS